VYLVVLWHSTDLLIKTHSHDAIITCYVKCRSVIK
jgi:hypothetical protein